MQKTTPEKDLPTLLLEALQKLGELQKIVLEHQSKKEKRDGLLPTDTKATTDGKESL